MFAIIFAIWAFGAAVGKFLSAFKSVAVQRWGRGFEIGAGFMAGLTGLQLAINADSVIPFDWDYAASAVVIMPLMVWLLYGLEKSGRLKPPGDGKSLSGDDKSLPGDGK
jgi:hypothetical protein